MAYYYDGVSYDEMGDVLNAVRNDLDFCLSDSDLDRYLRSSGGVQVDGEYVVNSLALKRSSHLEYRNLRNEFIDCILSELNDSIESAGFPFRVPFTFGEIEYLE